MKLSKETKKKLLFSFPIFANIKATIFIIAKQYLLPSLSTSRLVLGKVLGCLSLQFIYNLQEATF